MHADLMRATGFQPAFDQHGGGRRADVDLDADGAGARLDGGRDRGHGRARRREIAGSFCYSVVLSFNEVANSPNKIPRNIISSSIPGTVS